MYCHCRRADDKSTKAYDELLLATGNKGKICELCELLEAVDFSIITLDDLAKRPDMPDETGDTYEENSKIKALAIAEESGHLTLADDSGLEVLCLDNRPGVHSSRYGSDDETRIKRLHTELAERIPTAARFVCVVTLALPNGQNRTFFGQCKGQIIGEKRGYSGFGYDPVFLVEGKDKTMAELSATEKNELSHRARAVRAAAQFLMSQAGKDWLQGR